MNELQSLVHNPTSISYFILIFLYAILLFSSLRAIITQSKLRRLSSYFVVGAFVLLICFFVDRIVSMATNSAAHNLDMVLILVGIIPAGVFIFLRRETVSLSQLVGNRDEEFNQMKDEFLTVASHELRTPLSVINGFAEILVRCKLGPLNDEQIRRVKKILLQAERLNYIIDELLDMSRIRSGKIEIYPVVFDVVPLLKSCIDDYRIVADQSKIEIVDEIPDILPDIYADFERFSQIVINLLGNAIKYTPDGGKVTISAEHLKSSGALKVTIQDTGIGIDLEDQRKVFDEFFRVSSQTGGKIKGTGLGLSIVKELVHSQGGRLGVSSEGRGHGSSFFFTFPTAKASEQEFIKEPPKNEGKGQ